MNQESSREKYWKRKTTFQAGRNEWMLTESKYSELRLWTEGREVSNVSFGSRPESVPSGEQRAVTLSERTNGETCP